MTTPTDAEAIERIAVALWDETRAETEPRSSTQLAKAAWREAQAIIAERAPPIRVRNVPRVPFTIDEE